MARRAAICTAPTATAAPHLRRLRLAPAAPWPVGLSTARWIAVTPFLKHIVSHIGHAHGKVGDVANVLIPMQPLGDA